MLSKEELLNDRYKVVAPWPEMGRWLVNVGDIITEGIKYETARNQNGDAVPTFEWETFPHLFKKLQWWEDRDFDLSGMYVRFGDLDKAHSYYQLIEKIDYPYTEMWHMKGRISNHQYPLTDSIPATEQEFLDFINYAQPNH